MQTILNVDGAVKLKEQSSVAFGMTPIMTANGVTDTQNSQIGIKSSQIRNSKE